MTDLTKTEAAVISEAAAAVAGWRRRRLELLVGGFALISAWCLAVSYAATALTERPVTLGIGGFMATVLASSLLFAFGGLCVARAIANWRGNPRDQLLVRLASRIAPGGDQDRPGNNGQQPTEYRG